MSFDPYTNRRCTHFSRLSKDGKSRIEAGSTSLVVHIGANTLEGSKERFYAGLLEALEYIATVPPLRRTWVFVEPKKLVHHKLWRTINRLGTGAEDVKVSSAALCQSEELGKLYLGMKTNVWFSHVCIINPM